ncbi:hypothetical protein VB779_17260 [Haloarculaceae archaeon H-GB11]|nr:hypothetical protein [Haloarculaceae archaeon H-GB11]
MTHSSAGVLTLAIVAVLAMATGGVGAQEAAEPTTVDSCTTINESGQYVLDGSLANVTANQSSGLVTEGGAVQGCVVVNASDVVLDGDGVVVDGTMSSEPRNLTLQPAATVSAENETNATATPAAETVTPLGENVTAENVTADETVGIVVHDPNGTVSNVTVRDVGVSDWYWGVAVVDADNVTVASVTAERTAVGVELVNVTNATLENASGLG